MNSRFSSITALPLCLIWVLACWPLRPTDQRNLDPSKTEVLATDGSTGLQQAQDSRTADPQTATKDADPLFPVVEHRKWGYMDKTGKLVIAPKYYNAFPFTEGMVRMEPFAVLVGKAVRIQFIDKS